MAYKMKFKNLEGVVDQLHNASKMHKRQAKIVEGHIDKMEKSGPPKKRGLWDNIHAKRRRGETMRKPGDPGAPTEQALKESQTKKGAPKKDCNCWPGHSRVPGTEPCAPGSCKKDSPAKLTDAQYNKSNVKMRKKHKKETGKTLGDQVTSGTNPRRVSFAARFGGANDPVKDSKGDLTKHGHALKRWGFSSNAQARAFANKHKKA